MNNKDGIPDNRDAYFHAIKNSTDNRVVEKMELATFAASIPEGTIIFAYEGRDDKVIFYHWINRIDSTLRYEPFICKNKWMTLRLFDSLNIDLTGLKDRVYFFVDRDFDDTGGRTPNSKLFVTDKYSVENYVVCSELLDDILKIDFHCEGMNDLRKEIIAAFETVYAQFLNVTRAINFRIFLSRKLNIRQLDDLPERINLIARVELHRVWANDRAISDIVPLDREPTQDEMARFADEFDQIVPASGYRGKFALRFFVRWLEHLRKDRNAEASHFFAVAPATDFAIGGNFSLDTLAPKTPPPAQLVGFIGDVRAA
ncbi:DUF4435 domain-containing protein [Pararobbsia alpina]|uniref:DUF4435 domain-containing protein n=1 Tax=Pararobbsia alpina TaxID=621374 RepID=A0A6S7B2J2_9BURK|nr:DUF4435 domain-containing protein [Pararobbsia alpina]CAB3783410.1 hypothetical protein LMG28138_01634 [Pararobbsia alpina]